MPDPIPVSVASLLLDLKNPRLATEPKSQRAAIRALAKHQGSRLVALASDIVEHGLDPSELFIVVEIRKGQFKGRFRVIDGNRRLTALKVLENPNLVDGAVSGSAFRALKELRKSYDPGVNEVVLCILVDSRAEAGHWIELKHTGYQEAGPLRWRPDEGQRFRAASRGELPPAETQALNFLQERGGHRPGVQGGGTNHDLQEAARYARRPGKDRTRLE